MINPFLPPTRLGSATDPDGRDQLTQLGFAAKNLLNNPMLSPAIKDGLTHLSRACAAPEYKL